MAFTYKQNELYAENVNISDIVKVTDTPVYCYSLGELRNNFRAYKRIANSLICFAVKSNPNLSILRAIAELGGGADTVSEGEIRLALAAGVPADKIIFSGVGKKESEIIFALKQRIYQINVESLDELELVDRIAAALRVRADVAVRLNPDIDSFTHVKTATGLSVNKFGVPLQQVKNIDVEELSNVRLVGLSCHIGSGISRLKIVVEVLQYLKKATEELKALRWPIQRVDIGGGLGISYSHRERFPTISEYVDVVDENLKDCGYQIICEPGRAIVASAGVLVARVLYEKFNSRKTHVVIDAGMNDLMRPALYDCVHQIIPLTEDDALPKRKVDIVGPVCETGDTFAEDYEMQKLKSGDLMAICDAGAYCMSMFSNYNSRLAPAEVLVLDNRWDVIRERETYSELLARTKISRLFFG